MYSFAPAHNDGLLEVVGLRSGWHTAAVIASRGDLVHARRICQASALRLEVQAPYLRTDGQRSHTYMQVCVLSSAHALWPMRAQQAAWQPAVSMGQ